MIVPLGPSPVMTILSLAYLSWPHLDEDEDTTPSEIIPLSGLSPT